MHINTMITILTYILHIYYIYVERVRSKVSREEEDTVFQKNHLKTGAVQHPFFFHNIAYIFIYLDFVVQTF